MDRPAGTQLPPDDPIVKSAVQLMLTSDLSRHQVADTLGVGIQTLDRWVRDAIRQSPHHETFDQLVREVLRLRRENASLRKAASARKARGVKLAGAA